jgi:hypothetical protein
MNTTEKSSANRSAAASEGKKLKIEKAVSLKDHINKVTETRSSRSGIRNSRVGLMSQQSKGELSTNFGKDIEEVSHSVV